MELTHKDKRTVGARCTVEDDFNAKTPKLFNSTEKGTNVDSAVSKVLEAASSSVKGTKGYNLQG